MLIYHNMSVSQSCLHSFLGNPYISFQIFIYLYIRTATSDLFISVPTSGVLIRGFPSTVEPPKKGHFGNGTFVLSSEVVLISEVHEIL